VGIEVNFKGKVALVTGASSGLGERFAQILAEAGATVVLAARRTEKLKELRAQRSVVRESPSPTTTRCQFRRRSPPAASPCMGLHSSNH